MLEIVIRKNRKIEGLPDELDAVRKAITDLYLFAQTQLFEVYRSESADYRKNLEDILSNLVYDGVILREYSKE